MAGVTISPSPTYLTRAAISFTTTGAQPIVAAVAGLVVRAYRILIVPSAADTITFQDGSTALSGAMIVAVSTPIILDNSGDPWFQTSTGNALNINHSAGTGIMGAVWYTQTPPLGG